MPTITDLGTVVREFRENLASILSTEITDATVINGHPVRIEPGSLPAVMLDMVTIRRVEPDEGDSQLGTRDWHLEVPIEIYVDALLNVQDPAAASAAAEQLACRVIALIDSDPTLGNWGDNGGLYSGIEAVTPSFEPFVGSLNESAHPVLGYDGSLHAWLLLPETT